MTKPLIAITGATSGIGLETAKLFDQQGYPLLLIGRNWSKVQDTFQQAICAELDITNLSALQNTIAEAEALYGAIDLFINNAGMMLLNPLDEQVPSEWQTMIDTNILGVMNGMSAVLKSMKARRGGTIMNVSSIAGIKPFPNHAAYTATKFAVHGLSENVRQEVAEYNVRVITLAPGAVETPLLSHTNNDQIKADYQQWKQQMGGVLTAEEVANVITFAYNQPQHLCLREIVLSATAQVA
jgi:NADP-dependent 3-hydroxy acid dehydrogenase YdfG